jgi:hypothetical protein
VRRDDLRRAERPVGRRAGGHDVRGLGPEVVADRRAADEPAENRLAARVDRQRGAAQPDRAAAERVVRPGVEARDLLGRPERLARRRDRRLERRLAPVLGEADPGQDGPPAGAHGERRALAGFVNQRSLAGLGHPLNGAEGAVGSTSHGDHRAVASMTDDHGAA